MFFSILVLYLLLVNSQMIFFFLCNFFLTASLTGTFPYQIFIKISQMAFNWGLFIVLINANACFLVLVASTCRNAWCVFTDILMVTMSENPLLHCFYFISSVMSSIVFCKTTLVEFPQSICRCKDVSCLVCLGDMC